MADCAICCISGLTPTPATSDPCVANAGKGAIFVGTTGLVYIRRRISVPSNALDWDLMSTAVGGASVIQATASIVGGASPTLSGGTTAVPINWPGQAVNFTLTNPSTFRTMYVHLISTSWCQVGNLGGNSNVDFRHFVTFNADAGVWTKEQSAGIPSQEAMSTTVSRTGSIAPGGSMAVKLYNIFLVYSGSPFVITQRISYSYQIVSIG